MSAWLSPTWGRAAEVFSTLTAMTGFPLTLPPVSGSPGCALGLAVGEGVGVEVRLGMLALVGDSAAGGVPAESLHAPTPPASNTAAVTTARARARRRIPAFSTGEVLRTADTPAGVRPRRADRGTS